MNYLCRALITLFLAVLPLCGAIAEDSSPTVGELHAMIASKTQEREVLIANLDESKKALRKEESTRSMIRLNLRKLELNAKRLKFSPDKDTEEVKNEIISLDNEIKSHKARLKGLKKELDEAKKKQTEDSLKIGLLEEELKKLKVKKDEAEALQIMQAQKTAEQQPEQLDQQPSEPAEITQLEEVVATESDEANEQERIRAAKRKALASQTRLPEPTADEEQASEVIEAPASVEPQAQVAKKTFDLELEKAKLIDEARNMRPAAAALNHAKARALEPMTEPPLFGDQVDLATSLPPRSKPKSLGIMRHLGNNQYMLQIPVQKGKQEFVVGDYRFFKMVPKQFHQSLCMILLDFRNKENPGFQLLFID